MLGALLVVWCDRLLALFGVGFATQTDASFVSGLMEESKGSQRHPSTRGYQEMERKQLVGPRNDP